MIQNSGRITIKNFYWEINEQLIGNSEDTPFHLSSETVPNPFILLHFQTGKVILIVQFYCIKVDSNTEIYMPINLCATFELVTTNLEIFPHLYFNIPQSSSILLSMSYTQVLTVFPPIKYVK
jgi:hypothetical protein